MVGQPLGGAQLPLGVINQPNNQLQAIAQPGAASPNELEDFHFRFKVSIVGDSGVGKTAFLDAISSTLGTVVENEESTELHIKTTFYIDDAYQYKIVYFDIPGKERHHKYVHKYVLGSTCCLYLFNIAKRRTFEQVEQWIQETDQCQTPIRMLIGNMVDLTTNPKTAKNL